MHVIRLPRAVAIMVFLLPYWASAQPAALNAPATTLHDLVESAWQRSPQARALLARQDESAASRELAGSWLAAAPVLGLSQRHDRWTGQGGQRETEVALSTSIWTPGQKSHRQDLALAAVAELDTQILRARLEVAGQVRTHVWAAAAAKEQLLEKEDHLVHLEELARDVQRRVGAGDLPRSDALLAQQEVLAARSGVIAARGNARTALARLTVLTGQATLPPPTPEPLAPATAALPVQLNAAQAAEQRARAALAAAAALPAAAPTISLSMRREREGLAAPNDRSIGLALQIPLSGKVRNRPLEAAAATQLAVASAELAQTQAQMSAELAVAQARLEDAAETLALAEQRAAAALQHTQLFEKAFALGERPLPELLRSRIQAHEAQLAVRQQRIALGQAHAELNQALGLIP